MSTNSESTKILRIEEIQIRRRVRCISCELVQWATRPNCRRCGIQLPQPVINVVEVEKPASVEIIVPIDRPCPVRAGAASRRIVLTQKRGHDQQQDGAVFRQPQAHSLHMQHQNPIQVAVMIIARSGKTLYSDVRKR